MFSSIVSNCDVGLHVLCANSACSSKQAKHHKSISHITHYSQCVKRFEVISASKQSTDGGLQVRGSCASLEGGE